MQHAAIRWVGVLSGLVGPESELVGLGRVVAGSKGPVGTGCSQSKNPCHAGFGLAEEAQGALLRAAAC